MQEVNYKKRGRVPFALFALTFCKYATKLEKYKTYTARFFAGEAKKKPTRLVSSLGKENRNLHGSFLRWGSKKETYTARFFAGEAKKKSTRLVSSLGKQKRNLHGLFLRWGMKIETYTARFSVGEAK